MRILIKFEDGQGVGNQLWNYISLYNFSFHNGIDTEIDISSCSKLIELLGDIPFENFHYIYTETQYTIYELKANFIFNEVFANEESIKDAISILMKESTENLVWIKGVMQDLNAIDGFQKTPLFDYIKNYILKSKQDTPRFLVHIRGGDFLATTSCLTRSYYENALKLAKLNSLYSPAIVTNDIAYSRYLLPQLEICSDSILSPSNAKHHIGGHVGRDFLALANADFLVLSNSTFAFWAGYFSNAVVFAPRYWFANNYGWNLWSPYNSNYKSWIYIDSNFLNLPKIDLRNLILYNILLYKIYKLIARIRCVFLRYVGKTDWRPL